MIAAIVLCSTAGEVLTAAAMKSIGDLDEIRAHSGLKGAIRAVLTCPAVLCRRRFSGARFLLAAVRAQSSESEPGCARFGFADPGHQRDRGQAISERECRSPALGRCGAGLRRRLFSGALKRAFSSRTHFPDLADEPHQPARLQIGNENRVRIADALADCLSGEVAGSGRAFHGRGPTGCGPVAGEKAVGPRRCRGGLALSIPGGTPKVACISFTRTAFSSFASAALGKNSDSSLTAFEIACSRGSAANSREALTTNSR